MQEKSFKLKSQTNVAEDVLGETPSMAVVISLRCKQ